MSSKINSSSTDNGGEDSLENEIDKLSSEYISRRGSTGKQQQQQNHSSINIITSRSQLWEKIKSSSGSSNGNGNNGTLSRQSRSKSTSSNQVKVPAMNQYQREHFETQQILADLEQQRGLHQMDVIDLAPPRAWRPKSNIFLDDDDDDNNARDSSRNAAAPAETRTTSIRRLQFRAIFFAATLGVIIGLIIRFTLSSSLFSKNNNNGKTTDSSEKEGSTNSNEEGAIEEKEPSFYPTYSPTLSLNFGGDADNNINDNATTANNWTINSTTITPTPTGIITTTTTTPTSTTTTNFGDGNITTITEDDELGSESLEETIDSNVTTTSTSTSIDSTTTVGSSNFDNSMTNSSSSTDVTVAFTIATTTMEDTTTTLATTLATTTSAAAGGEGGAITATSPYLCTETTNSGGKIFKITITPATSTTTVELLKLVNNDNSDTFSTVIKIPQNDNDSSSFLPIGQTYTQRICLLPGNYKFVIITDNNNNSSSGGGNSNNEEGVGEKTCYTGYLRGTLIFEECDNDGGEYIFEVV